MKICIDSEKVDVINGSSELLIYSTVDLDIVLRADKSSYMTSFSKYVDNEKNIYEDLINMIASANTMDYSDNKYIDINDDSVTFYSVDRKSLLSVFSNDGIVSVLLTNIADRSNEIDNSAVISIKYDGENGYELLYPVLHNGLLRYSSNEEKIYQKRIG